MCVAVAFKRLHAEHCVAQATGILIKHQVTNVSDNNLGNRELGFGSMGYEKAKKGFYAKPFIRVATMALAKTRRPTARASQTKFSVARHVAGVRGVQTTIGDVIARGLVKKAARVT